MERRKHRIPLAAVAFSAAFLIAFLSLQVLLDWAAKKAVEYVAMSLAKDGIVLEHPEYKGVGPSWINAVTIRGFYAYFRLTQHNVFQIERNFELTIEKITLSVTDLFKQEFMLTLKGGAITMQPEYGKTYVSDSIKKDERDKFIIKEMKVRLRVDVFKPALALEQVRAATKAVAQFAKYGKTKMPVTFRGSSVFVVRDKQVSARLYAEKGEGDEYYLLMDKDDYKVMCSDIGERLTEAELELYSHNPLRIPRMTKIRNYASDKGREAQTKFGMSQDAVKHVFWAYLLTQAYDEKFSETVTDAHETGAIGREELSVRTYLETEKGMDRIEGGLKRTEEAEMDLINNMIGRDYAKKDYLESTIIERMKTDDRVVWHWTDLAENRKTRLSGASAVGQPAY